MNAVIQLYPGIFSGVLHGGFIIFLFLSLRMLPDTHRAKLLKQTSGLWLLLFAIWLVMKP